MIFDCDGVLVDSEPIAANVLAEALQGAGLAIDETLVYQQFLGRSVTSIGAALQDDFNFPDGPALIASTRKAILARLETDLKPTPHIRAALASLPYSRCVASSSQPERIRLSLRVAGLAQFLEPHLFSASMVKNGKPAPDLFLYAAASMGVDPARCVVIEDSPAGVLAAKQAGMRVVGYTGGGHAGPANLQDALRRLEPDAMIDDMGELGATLLALAEENVCVSGG